MNRDCSGYAGRIPVEVVVEAIANAAGRYGPAHDYLFRTVETLRQHGIRDISVERVATLVRQRIAIARTG